MTIDLGAVPPSLTERRVAGVAIGVLAGLGLLTVAVASGPAPHVLPLVTALIAVSGAAVSLTAILLYAQARVTRSAPLLVLALCYALAALAMLPYLLFYPEFWPQAASFASADPQTSRWLWVIWHLTLSAAPLAYLRAGTHWPAPIDVAAFRTLRTRLVAVFALLAAALIAPCIWIDNLPAQLVNGTYTQLARFTSLAILATAGTSLVVLWRWYMTSVLNLWLAFMSAAILVDVGLATYGTAPFLGTWYFSRLMITIAASSVLTALVIQMVRSYGELAQTADRLSGEARTDVLTNVPNRRRFDEELEHSLGLWRRSQVQFAMAMIDIDHFKRYNDACGHGAGDVALTAVAGAISTSLPRATDFMARYGGEEFAALIDGSSPGGAGAVAERARSAVAGLKICSPDGTPLTISVGVTLARSGDTAASLTARADQALYRAKDAGRDRVVIADGDKVSA